LHFGSLVAALASFLEARSRGGEWLLRIEDVDPPRVVAGAAASILRTLAAHGFEWDGGVLYQSRRSEAYQDALARLMAAGRVYACVCSRKRIADLAGPGVDGPVYPGTCRGRESVVVAAGVTVELQPRPTPCGDTAAAGALRFLLCEQRVVFQDVLLGRVACNVMGECGDFVLKRADGVFTYHIAVVVDDAEQGITHVVRGADLLTSTPRQIVLQQALGYPTPTYTHLPVVLDAQGFKLSKQTLAAPLDAAAPLPALRLAGRFLGLPEIGHVGHPRNWLGAAIRLWPSAATPSLRGRTLGLPTSSG
jgi:glutamyl-Q tRNA(Asp) synthetase